MTSILDKLESQNGQVASLQAAVMSHTAAIEAHTQQLADLYKLIGVQGKEIVVAPTSQALATAKKRPRQEEPEEKIANNEPSSSSCSSTAAAAAATKKTTKKTKKQKQQPKSTLLEKKMQNVDYLGVSLNVDLPFKVPAVVIEEELKAQYKTHPMDDTVAPSTDHFSSFFYSDRVKWHTQPYYTNNIYIPVMSALRWNPESQDRTFALLRLVMSGQAGVYLNEQYKTEYQATELECEICGRSTCMAEYTLGLYSSKLDKKQRQYPLEQELACGRQCAARFRALQELFHILNNIDVYVERANSGAPRFYEGMALRHIHNAVARLNSSGGHAIDILLDKVDKDADLEDPSASSSSSISSSSSSSSSMSSFDMVIDG
jgi:hypothetical protein